MSKFVRFELLTRNPDSAQPDGLFVIAYKIISGEVSDVPQYYVSAIAELVSWFKEHLPVPDRFARSVRKNAKTHTPGISWFKSDAPNHISKMRELAALLQECGYPTVERTTDRPGRYVYEDRFQIVAEAFWQDT